MSYFQELGWFTSSSEKKKKADRYKKILYPFGQQQIDWENDVLKEIFVNHKRNQIVDNKYYLLVMKEKYLIDSLIDEDKKEMISDSYQANCKVLERFNINQKDKVDLDKLAYIQINASDMEDMAQKTKEQFNI